MRDLLTLFLVFLSFGSGLAWLSALSEGRSAAQHMQTIAIAFIALYFVHRKEGEKEKPVQRPPADSKRK
jgi:hypothetical protein